MIKNEVEFPNVEASTPAKVLDLASGGSDGIATTVQTYHRFPGVMVLSKGVTQDFIVQSGME